MTIRARLLAIKDAIPYASSAEPSAFSEGTAGAAKLASRSVEPNSHKLSAEQETAIAALLIEPTYSRAAAAASIDEGTLYRWLHLPAFRTAFRQARRELVEAGVGRLQAATSHAVDALVAVARHGRRGWA